MGGHEGPSLEERFGLETLAQIPIEGQLTNQINQPVKNSHMEHAIDQVIRSLGKNSIMQKHVPVIKFDEKNTYLKWPGGEELSVSNRDLRLSCRCAVCVDEITGRELLNPQAIRADIAPKSITSLGNYAIGIDWNDGHSSGIYPYKSIRELAGIAKN